MLGISSKFGALLSEMLWFLRCVFAFGCLFDGLLFFASWVALFLGCSWDLSGFLRFFYVFLSIARTYVFLLVFLWVFPGFSYIAL